MAIGGFSIAALQVQSFPVSLDRAFLFHALRTCKKYTYVNEALNYKYRITSSGRNYATAHFHATVSRTQIPDLSFTHRAMYSAPLNDGQWHHICVTWRNSDGKWVFFVDGFGRISGDALATNHAIKSNGRFVVGQAQLSFGGSFDPGESFAGEISQLNVWGSDLGRWKVESIFANASSKESGDTLDWRDILANVIGEVLIKKPSDPLGKYVLWMAILKL